MLNGFKTLPVDTKNIEEVILGEIFRVLIIKLLGHEQNRVVHPLSQLSVAYCVFPRAGKKLRILF